MIVDEADEDLEMAEDPFLEAGIPELPEFPSLLSNKILNPDNVSIAISNASDLPIEISKLSHIDTEESTTQGNDVGLSSYNKDHNSQINVHIIENDKAKTTLQFDNISNM